MAFEPLIKEAAPAAPAAPAQPDNQAILNAQIAAQQQIAELAKSINASYQANRGLAQPPQVQYIPYVPEAPPQPLTEAEILADIPGAMERVAREREQAVREEVGGHLKVLYERDFDRDRQNLSQQPYFKYVQDKLDAHFTLHPEEKYSPGRLKQKYDELVGASIETIQAEREAALASEPSRGRAVDHAISVTTSPAVGRTAEKAPAVVLDPVREELRQYFNQTMRLNMSPEEWAAIESGKELGPTRRGAGAPPAGMTVTPASEFTRGGA